MSQFILWRGSNPTLENTQKYPFPNSFLNTVSEKLWNDTKENLYTIDQIDDVCTKAQENLQHNMSFEDTQLYSLLQTLVQQAEEIVLWYGDYYTDLPQTTNQEQFFENIKKAIHQPACETYIWYTKKIIEIPAS